MLWSLNCILIGSQNIRLVFLACLYICSCLSSVCICGELEYTATCLYKLNSWNRHVTDRWWSNQNGIKYCHGKTRCSTTRLILPPTSQPTMSLHWTKVGVGERKQSKTKEKETGEGGVACQPRSWTSEPQPCTEATQTACLSHMLFFRNPDCILLTNNSNRFFPESIFCWKTNTVQAIPYTKASSFGRRYNSGSSVGNSPNKCLLPFKVDLRSLLWKSVPEKFYE
jgi:hypothetical protein